MSPRRRKKPSLLPLGRTKFIVGTILIVAVSVGLAYFFAHQRNETRGQARPAVVTPESPAVIPRDAEKATPSSLSGTGQTAPVQHSDARKGPDTGRAAEERDRTQQPSTTEEQSGQRGAEKKGHAIEQPGRMRVEKRGLENGATALAEQEKAPKSPEKFEKAPKADPSGRVYTIQFGAFSTSQGAERLKESLAGQGIEAEVVRKDKDGPPFRVRVGSFGSRKDAEQEAVAVREKTGLPYHITTH